MVHAANWLFQIPEGGSFVEQKLIVQARVEADPGARAISDEEAEAFFTSAFSLAFAPPDVFALCAKAYGIRGQPTNNAFRRQATLLILRAWRRPKMQEPLRIMRTSMRFDDLAAADEGPTKLSLDVLERAFHRGQNVIWLCNLLRHTDRADQIPAFLARLNEWAAEVYAVHLNIGRLMIRRIVDGVGVQATQPKQSAQQLKAQLKQRIQGEAQAKREMKDQRTRLARQERIRQAKATELTSYLEGLRQEVAATEARLAETLAQQASEEVLLLQQQQARLTELEMEAGRVEADFVDALGALATAWPLAGLRVAIVGDWGEAEQLLIESAGGRLVPRAAHQADLLLHLGQHGVDQPKAGLFFTPERGPAALEKLLHRRILPHINHFRPS